MSSIAAVFHRNDTRADPRAIGAMLDAMAFRAPDGRFAQCDGPVGLGLGLLDTARDGLAVSNGIALALDGRLDHAAALAAALGIERPARDTDLLLAGYRRWGPDVVRRLEGDFAFALWDAALGRLLVARDPLGVRPIYYHESGDALWVASHPAAIAAAAPSATRTIDRGVAAAFAVGLAWPVDRTIHPNLRRLPPGYLLTASRGGVTTSRWFEWRITPRRRGEEPPGRFAELLAETVAQHLDSRQPIGALLSGGLDSSSIVALAAPQGSTARPALRTYSQIYPNSPAGDERPFIDAMISRGGLDPVLVDEEDIAPFASYPSLLHDQFMPVIAPNIATTNHTLGLVARDGVRVLLDGHGGDETVSHGARWLRDLAWRLRAIAMWRAVRPYAAANGQSARRIFLATMRRYGPWRSTRQYDHPPQPWLAAGCRPLLADEPLDRPGDESRTGHLLDAIGPYSVQANETSNHLASAHGIELRFPMLDRRLIEWCVAAPGDEKFADGHSRLLLRRGMAGILPEMVRWRGDKHDFTGHVARGLARDSVAIETALADPDGRLGQFFNVAVLSERWQAVRATPNAADGGDVQLLWRAVLLARWLERHGGELTERDA